MSKNIIVTQTLSVKEFWFKSQWNSFILKQKQYHIWRNFRQWLVHAIVLLTLLSPFSWCYPAIHFLAKGLIWYHRVVEFLSYVSCTVHTGTCHWEMGKVCYATPFQLHLAPSPRMVTCLFFPQFSRCRMVGVSNFQGLFWGYLLQELSTSVDGFFRNPSKLI